MHEGGVQATESKTRFIGTAVALLVARAAGGQRSHTCAQLRRESRSDHRPDVKMLAVELWGAVWDSDY